MEYTGVKGDESISCMTMLHRLEARCSSCPYLIAKGIA